MSGITHAVGPAVRKPKLQQAWILVLLVTVYPLGLLVMRRWARWPAAWQLAATLPLTGPIAAFLIQKDPTSSPILRWVSWAFAISWVVVNGFLIRALVLQVPS